MSCEAWGVEGQQLLAATLYAGFEATSSFPVLTFVLCSLRKMLSLELLLATHWQYMVFTLQMAPGIWQMTMADIQEHERKVVQDVVEFYPAYQSEQF